MESGLLASGRFSIQRRIGAGGMGVVYEALDHGRGHVVALKKLFGTDATAIYRLKNEFRALADIAHPNLVRLYELIGDGDEWFFTMELVEGVDFLHHVRGRSRLEIEETTETSTLVDTRADSERTPVPLSDTPQPLTPQPITPDRSEELTRERLPGNYEAIRRSLRQIGDGVAALHDAGTLHRDLKPSNVLVTASGRVVILDFGLATDVSAFQRKMTFGGTPAYMAPEQIADMPATEASDCYSIGVMLYEALTGTLPFAGDFYTMLMQKRSTDPTPPLEIVAGIPEELSRLCVDLLKRNPEDRPPAREVVDRLADVRESKLVSAVTLARQRETPFVGRVAQLAQLDDAFAATEEGKPVTVMVRGESGMGKTALVRTFLHEVQRRDPDVVVFSGRCYEQESVPYKAVDSLIDDLARYLKRVTPLEARALLPTDIAALARLFPVLQELEVMTRGRRKAVDIRDSQELRRRAFSALRELLARMSDDQKVILFLDDVQWGDRDSAALLAEILRPPNAPPVLLVVSARTEESESSPLLVELKKLREMENALGEVRDITLGELTRTESRDLARTVLHDPGPITDRADAIARESGGSPFFIVELARFSEMTGIHTTDYVGGEMMLDSVIRARIALLPAVARDLLEVVAVAGRPVAASAANLAANLPAGDQAMQARLRADHLLRTRVRAGRDELDTYHDRIREAILVALPSVRRREHHLVLAQTLEVQGGHDPELLAVHYIGAGQEAKAAAYALEAGDRAGGALAFENAAHFYAMASALERSQRPELLMKLGDSLANAGRGPDAAAYYLRAAEQSAPRVALELRRRASEAWLRSGYVDEGLRMIRSVLASVGVKFPETPRRAVLGVVLGRLRLLLRGLRFTERTANEIDSEDLTRIDVLWGVTTGLSRIDNVRAAYFQPIHLRLALEAGEPLRIARALASEACFAATQGGRNRRRTEKVVLQAERTARRVGEAQPIGMSVMARSLESYYLGLFRDAFQKAEEAGAIFRERCTGAQWEINTSVNYSLSSLVYLGELSQLSQRVPQRLREAEELGDLYAGIDPVGRPGIVWLALDDPDTGRRALRAVMDRWSLQGFHLQHYLELLAENQIDLYEGKWASAWRRAAERWPLMKASFLTRVPFLRLEAQHLIARSALAAAIASRDRTLIKVAEEHADSIERADNAWSTPLAWSLRAAGASLRGRPEEAVTLLDRATRAFERSEMMLYAKAATHRRGAIVGGDEGRELMTASQTWMQGQGVRNVAKMVDVLMPGFA